MRLSSAFLAAAFLITSAPALSQSSPAGSSAAGSTRSDRSDWGDNPRLGLLGLLGLGGLLGLMRREPSIHIDARREKSPIDS